jgi:hypothetical protein
VRRRQQHLVARLRLPLVEAPIGREYAERADAVAPRERRHGLAVERRDPEPAGNVVARRDFVCSRLQRGSEQGRHNEPGRAQYRVSHDATPKTVSLRAT